jgi:exodeoxyribonuclease VII small subunit
MNSKSKSPETPPNSFENSLAKLEQLVSKLEDSGISLEASLSAFEEGVLLTREAQRVLSTAEQKVRVLIEENGQPAAQSFAENEADG